MQFSGLDFMAGILNGLMEMADPVMLAVIIVTSPLVLTVVAARLLEERWLPLIGKQSRAFTYGGICLIIAVASAVLGAAECPSSQLGWWSQNGAAVALLIALFNIWQMRVIHDAPKYDLVEGATGHSISKWVHDIANYFWYTYLIVAFGVPALAAAIYSPSSTTMVYAGVFVLMLLLHFLIYLWDKSKIDDECRRAMHPDDKECTYRRVIELLRGRS